MHIIDESGRVQDLARRAFGPAVPDAQDDADNPDIPVDPAEPPDDRAKLVALELLREFCYSAASEAEAALWNSGDWNRAVAAAVEAYQKQRQKRIAYRQKIEGT